MRPYHDPDAILGYDLALRVQMNDMRGRGYCQYLHSNREESSFGVWAKGIRMVERLDWCYLDYMGHTSM